jgi:glutaredoxin
MKRFDVYTKQGCPWCDKAKHLLQTKGYTYNERVVGVSTSKDEIQARIDSLGINTQVRTVPQIFLIDSFGDKYIGGFDDLQRQVNDGSV